jgi:hypothetical protein
MKLYFEHTGGGHWELPGQQPKGASRVDIPSTPVAMVAWLNERRVPIAPGASSPGLLDYDGGSGSSFDAPPKPFVAAPAPATPQPSSFEATAIEEFILDRATVAEVERIFAVLGTRFAEARR